MESIMVAMVAARQLLLQKYKIGRSRVEAKAEDSIVKKMVAYASSQVLSICGIAFVVEQGVWNSEVAFPMGKRREKVKGPEEWMQVKVFSSARKIYVRLRSPVSAATYFASTVILK